MKTILQLFIIFLIVVIFYFFYVSYLKEDIKTQIGVKEKITKQQSNINNSIQDLKYEVVLNNIYKYTLNSKFTTISDNDGKELMNMKNVDAEIETKDNFTVYISSNNAMYNNVNNNTEFSEKVIIKYNDQIISADRMTLDFEKKLITVTGNINYSSLIGNITTDYIKIDLITQNITLYMNDNYKNVEFFFRQ